MKCWSGHMLATLLVLLAIDGAAHADQIPWTYSWSRNPISVAADNSGTGGVSLTLVPMVGTNMIGDNPSITAVNLSTFSSAPTGTVDTFTNSPFSLDIHLTDLNSGQSGDLAFSGVFNGSLSPTVSEITTSFTDATSKSILLGQNTYTVALASVQAPGLPDATTFGDIVYGVSITGASTTTSNPGSGNTGNPGPGVSVQDVPEPSTLLMVGMALPAGLAWWRTRGARRRETANG
jgi:hypothetical protein